VQLYGTWDGDSQKYRILASGSNWKIAMKANSNECLDLQDGSTASGTKIVTNGCNGSSTQAWAVTTNVQTGAFILRNVAANLCLDVTGTSTANGTPMDVYTCNGATNQQFKVQAVQ
jgi:hypothetical protein